MTPSERFVASVNRYGKGWSIRLKIDGKQGWGGSFATEDEARAAADGWNAAIAAGKTPPDFRKKVQAKKPGEELAESPEQTRPSVEPSTAIGSIEYRAKLSASMRASWARRRADADHAPAPARAIKSTRDPRPAPAAPARPAPAQLPPRCVRCFRVGHVEAECPEAAPAASASRFASSNEQPKPEQTAEAEPPFDAVLIEDDDSTDLTDLVDVPDAEPTVFPDVDLGVECQACCQRGHISSSPDCPLTTKPGADAEIKQRPGTPEEWARWREENPPSRKHGRGVTETRFDMRRHLAIVDADADADLVDHQRPRTRGECEGEPRPCPWAGCRHHLALDVIDSGNLHLTFGELDITEMRETCALDVADRGGATLENVGAVINLTRERVRQIETSGLERAARNARRHRMDFELPVTPGSNAPEDSL